MSSRGAGARYRLNIDIGTVFTSASYEGAEESGALQLSSFARDLPSAQFLADGRVQVNPLAETLRDIVSTAQNQLHEVPTSVGVSYPATWDPRQLLLLWEALVLGGIPDADTEPVGDPKPTVLAALSPVDHNQSPVAAVPARASRPAIGRRKRGWLAGAAILAVIAGVTAGVIATAVPRTAQTPAGTATSRSPVSSELTAGGPATTAEPTIGPGANLPMSAPLALQQFIVPRGKDAATQLSLATVAGVVGPRTLSTVAGRNSWPMLSNDRRTIIYINYVSGTLRTMAADGNGDRPLIESSPSGCGNITRASWSPADQTVMIIECRPTGRPDRLVVIKLDGTVVRELKTRQSRIEDPMISPDGRTVAYWARNGAGGSNGGSIYTLAMDGSSEPVRLTNRRIGSDADPAWSPDGTMIAFRRRGANDNFDVYLMRADGSGVRPIATGPAREEKPAWSPDGNQLMIISNRDASGEPATTYDVYVFDVDGGTPRPLGLTANVVLAPVWSYR